MGYIYKATNTINGKVYIGQTIKTVEQRWYEHCFYEHEKCVLLNRAIEKYGVKAFTIETIEECPNDQLDEKEKYWISYYNSFNTGYNMTLGGSSGFKFDYGAIVEAYENNPNIADLTKQFQCSHNTILAALETYAIKRKPQEKIIEMIDCQSLEVIRDFPSVADAARYFNGNGSTISAALTGKRHSAYGYYWREKGSEMTFQPFNSNRSNQVIIQCDKDTGEELNRFDSIAEANRFLGKAQYNGCISKAITGKAKTAHGYCWKRLNKK